MNPIELFSDHECTQPLKTIGAATETVTTEVTFFARNASKSSSYEIKISLNFPFAEVADDTPNMIIPQEVIPIKITWSPEGIKWQQDEEFRTSSGEIIVTRKIAGFTN